MHIAILRGSNYPYDLQELDSDRLANFETEVAKLMPALFFMASPDHRSRSLEYRDSQISESKYSAIHVLYGGFEYRLFETCYDRPSAILDNIEVIARTLEYYTPRRKAKTVQTRLHDQDYGEGLERFYKTPEALRALNEQLPLVKPKSKTVRELKKERNFTVTLSKLKRLQPRTRRPLFG